jgi:hypothetical protein
MNMYGVVIEGDYDEAALAEMIKRCSSIDIEIICRVCGGKEKLMLRFPNYLESFRHEKEGSHVDKAIVIRDADGKDPEELKRAMESKIRGRDYPFEVRLNIIVQELEAWLLADEEAISRVTIPRSGKGVSCPNRPPESIPNPKETLGGILSKAGVSYTRAVARDIAKEADLDRIEARCPKFKEFRQAVIDC